MIQAASDATETANKFNSVFDDVRVNANQVADDFSKSFGVAGSTARKMIGDTGDLLVGFGFSGDAALEMSGKVARLASDLTSFQNFAGGAEGANAALTKALLGETESAKSLGIVVRQGTNEFRKNVQMIMRTQRVTIQQAKAIEILRIATSQSQKAIGDVNRTWDDYASVVRRNEEATKELSESFGKIMIPLATKLTLVLTKLVKWVDSLSPEMKKLVLTLGGLVAIGGPLLLVLSGIAAAFTVISLPVILVSAAVLGLIAVGILLAANWEEIVSRLKSMWEGFSNFIKNMFDEIGNGFSLLFEGRLIDAIKTFANVGISNLNALLSPLDAIASLLGFDAGTIKIPEFNVNVEDAVLKNGQAPTAPVQSVNGAINGQITVSAAPGSQVKQTSLTSTSSGLNVGMNMVPG
jgi:phage-related minor tail protein